MNLKLFCLQSPIDFGIIHSQILEYFWKLLLKTNTKLKKHKYVNKCV